MKIRVKGETAERLMARLWRASEYYDEPGTAIVWVDNVVDPVTGELLNPRFPEGERVPFQPGLQYTEDGRLVYRNCYGETLAVIEDGAVTLTGRRHQALYGAPRMVEEPPGPNPDIEVLETSRPDLGWWQTAT